MRIAVGIVSLLPGGGLQRDCVEVCKIMRGAGHDVVIHTARLKGAVPVGDVPVVVIPNSAKTNHGLQYQFATEFLRRTSGSFDLIVGFDKLLGLDVLYCADPSMHSRLLRQPYLRLLPRYRRYSSLEGDSFRRGQKTRIIMLSHKQLSDYQGAWLTEPERLIELPPTGAASRRRPGYRVNGIREHVRGQLGLTNDAWIWLAIGVQPRTKGLDRVLCALPHFPEARLLIAGLNRTDEAAQRSSRKAQWLGVSSRVMWLGHCEEIERIIAAADVLMHPARYDTTGTVILEAIVNGLPVIATSSCGYAKHVEAAGAGLILPDPFDTSLFLAAISKMRDPGRRTAYSERGISYGGKERLYDGRLYAAQFMIDLAERRQGLVSDSPSQGSVVVTSLSSGDSRPQARRLPAGI